MKYPSCCEKYLPYVFFLVVCISALWLIKVLDISYPLVIKTTTVSSELAVVGEGKVDVVPDTIYVDAGIEVNNLSTADEAQKEIAKINNKIIEALKKLGVSEKDISTSNYSVYPDYNYEKERKITGYNGSATVTIKIKDKELASKVITETTNAGANRVSGTRFVVDQPEKYREEARNKAIANAREQAEKLASTLGIKLGRVVNIVESSPGNVYYAPKLASLGEGMGGGSEPDLQPGTQTITSTVTLYFEKR